MKTTHALALSFLTASLGLAACEQSRSDLGQQTENQTENITAVPANEALGSRALRDKICDAIVAAEGPGSHDGECTGFSYTITEFGRSTLYQKQRDQKPVTLTMKVEVDNPADEVTYEAMLKARFNDDYRIEYDAEIQKTPLQLQHAYIKSVARDVYYPHELHEQGEDVVRGVAFESLPTDIQTAFTKLRDDRYAWLNQHPDGPESDTFFGEEFGFGEILQDGEVVGYVVSLDDYHDHPLFVAAGVIIFVDVNGHSVVDVDWDA